MSPTVTIDTDSDPGSWAHHALLAARVDAMTTGIGVVRVAAGTAAHVPIVQFYAAPTCARCRAVLCGCSDHHWKG